MMRIDVFAALLVVATGVTICAAQEMPVRNVIALMYENRAFDHFLGQMQKFDSRVKGLSGNEWNPTLDGKKIQVTFDAESEVHLNADHQCQPTIEKINNGKMNGFVSVEQSYDGHPADVAAITMRAYNRSTLQTFFDAAQQFALYDQYHCSMPGPTEINRQFALSATSRGEIVNPDKVQIVEGYPQRTIFDDLHAENHSYGIYYSDFPDCILFQSVRKAFEEGYVQPISEFYKALRLGELPRFTWLEPAFFQLLTALESDMHPYWPDSWHNVGDVAAGEALLRQVYRVFRQSPHWNDTALIIYFDEHGGYFDSVVPPRTVNPDGKDYTSPTFNFTFEQVGIRVPCIVISPWLDEATVMHAPKPSRDGRAPRLDELRALPPSQFEHSSVIASVRELLKLKSPPLTKREAWATPLLQPLPWRSTPRTDCPKELSGSDWFTADGADNAASYDRLFAESEATRDLLFGADSGTYDAARVKHVANLFYRMSVRVHERKHGSAARSDGGKAARAALRARGLTKESALAHVDCVMRALAAPRGAFVPGQCAESVFDTSTTVPPSDLHLSWADSALHMAPRGADVESVSKLKSMLDAAIFVARQMQELRRVYSKSN